MIDFIANWWRSQRFRNALLRNNIRLAERLLREIQTSGTKLSLLERIFRDGLQAEQKLERLQKDVISLRQQVSQASQNLESQLFAQQQEFESVLQSQLRQHTEKSEEQIKIQIDQINELEKVRYAQFSSSILIPNSELIKFTNSSFKLKLKENDPSFLQFTGIDNKIFDRLETVLVGYFNSKLNKNIQPAFAKAYSELKKIRQGIDPDYSFELINYAYLVEYFLNNVYTSYLAWFLIYKSGLLTDRLKILDIAAGPATTLYGLASFLESLNREDLSQKHSSIKDIHIYYHCLEEQQSFLNAGFDMWQKYINNSHIASNTYWRFDRSNLFSLAENDVINRLPNYFFDFVIVCHCFFWDDMDKRSSFKVYADICKNNLNPDGYAVFIIQQQKLFRLFKKSPEESKEKFVVEQFTKSMGLDLVLFKYLSSTGIRGKTSDFKKFATQNLPPQKQLSKLKRDYLGLNYDSNYVLDDYVIVARKSSKI